MSHRSVSPPSTAAPSTAVLAGRALGVLSGVAARLRRSGKPLHPRGASFTGVLVRFGSVPAWGVPWLDTVGSSQVLVRLSRSAGLPAGWPDVNGIAVRLLDDGGDLLFSTTGSGTLTRFLLAPHRHIGGVHTTLMPFRTAAGPLLLRADLDGDPGIRSVAGVRLPVTVTLSAAPPRGAWPPFGHQTLKAPVGLVPDPPVSFDPLAGPPGLGSYPWAAALRGPAYAAARAVRGVTTG